MLELRGAPEYEPWPGLLTLLALAWTSLSLGSLPGSTLLRRGVCLGWWLGGCQLTSGAI